MSDTHTYERLDELPPRPSSSHGKQKAFVEFVMSTTDGAWYKYPKEYQNAADPKNAGSSAAGMVRKSYPQVEWAARGNFLYARKPQNTPQGGDS